MSDKDLIEEITAWAVDARYDRAVGDRRVIFARQKLRHIAEMS